METQKIQIVNLADRLDLVDLVSRWRWQEWNRDKPFEYVRYSAAHNTQRDRIPMTFMAMLQDRPVGMVSLWMNDLACRQDLHPWMASLYVDEAHRARGIGRQLQEHATGVARELGYPRIYLMTEHAGYYERFGWSFLELAPTPDGGETRIYCRELGENQGRAGVRL